ncbi:MAG: hypothetical protein AAF191_09300, partial [Verrucomicrobiota bacterium]
PISGRAIGRSSAAAASAAGATNASSSLRANAGKRSSSPPQDSSGAKATPSGKGPSPSPRESKDRSFPRRFPFALGIATLISASIFSAVYFSRPNSPGFTGNVPLRVGSVKSPSYLFPREAIPRKEILASLHPIENRSAAEAGDPVAMTRVRQRQAQPSKDLMGSLPRPNHNP